MLRWSPTAEGFRTIFQRPTVSFAEISWRWSFAAAAWLLGWFAFFEYLDTLPVSKGDLFFLRTGAPAFVLRTLGHIMEGSGFRVLLAIFIGSAGLAVLWIVIASLGRVATLQSLLESVRTRATSVTQLSSANSEIVERVNSGHPLRSIAGLHILRVGLFVMAVFGLVGAAFAASLFSPSRDPQPALAFFVFLMLALLISLVVISLNWFLSLATLFVVRDNEDTLGAVSAAMNLCRDRLGAVLAVGAWFGLAHLTFFVIATSLVGFPLSLLAIVPPGFVFLILAFITLLYFAIVDSLYIGRLAGYAAILEAPRMPLPLAVPPPNVSPIAFAASTTMPAEGSSAVTVDQSELILSDVPDGPRLNESEQ